MLDLCVEYFPELAKQVSLCDILGLWQSSIDEIKEGVSLIFDMNVLWLHQDTHHKSPFMSMNYVALNLAYNNYDDEIIIVACVGYIHSPGWLDVLMLTADGRLPRMHWFTHRGQGSIAQTGAAPTTLHPVLFWRSVAQPVAWLPIPTSSTLFCFWPIPILGAEHYDSARIGAQKKMELNCSNRRLC